jgi:hypothetical protein
MEAPKIDTVARHYIEEYVPANIVPTVIGLLELDLKGAISYGKYLATEKFTAIAQQVIKESSTKDMDVQ